MVPDTLYIHGKEACKQYYNIRYVRMPDLLMNLDITHSKGNYHKVMAKYSPPVLVIHDGWMLLKLTDTEQKGIFELLHQRRKKSSTIFCSQYVFEEWYDQLDCEDSPLAVALIDRIAHNSYQINITSIDAGHAVWAGARRTRIFAYKIPNTINIFYITSLLSIL